MITHQAEIFQGKLSTIVIFIRCKLCATTRVKISQNVDHVHVLPKVYLVHLKVKHCQTIRVVSTFTGQN